MYLGIEIGGTKLQLGLGDGDGTIHALWRGAVVPAEGADGIRRQIELAIPELLASAKRKRDELKGAGIGFGGPVDDATRTVIKSHQIAGWDGFPLADWISNLTGLPAVLGNDADVAGLAEGLFGAGKGLSPIFYITIGSGIGGGLIVNGEIYRGAGKGAAEIGHLRIYGPRHSEHGFAIYNEQVLESETSGWGIANHALLLDKCGVLGDSSALSIRARSNPESITVQTIGELAQLGDGAATRVLFEAWERLAIAISHVVALLCPRRIVIGGGVALMGEKLLFEPLRKKIAERVFKPFADCYDIVPAALGEEVVVHGALAMARKQV